MVVEWEGGGDGRGRRRGGEGSPEGNMFLDVTRELVEEIIPDRIVQWTCGLLEKIIHDRNCQVAIVLEGVVHEEVVRGV